MKKESVLSVILFGLCAVIWSVKASYEVIKTPYPITPTLLTLDVVCAICWIVAFAGSIMCYRSNKDEK